MAPSSSFFSELRQTVLLALPISATLLGQMLMGWVDSIMVGHLGVDALAACAFGNTVAMVFFVFGFGAISSVSVCASQAYGAKRKKEVGEIIYAGLFLGTGLGVLLGAMMIIGFPLYQYLGQPKEVVADAYGYIWMIGISILPAFLITVSKSFSESLSRPWIPFWIIMGSVLLNIFLNWVLIFGNLGAPALGLTGTGLATLLSRCAAVGCFFLLILKSSIYQPYLPDCWEWMRIKKHLPSMIRVGLPSAFQVLGEVMALALASLMMGWISVSALAAHQIAMTCIATTFMVPLGLSIAMSVRMGQTVGAKEYGRLRVICGGGLTLAILTMAAGAFLFITEGTWIAEQFVTDREVIVLGGQLLMIAGIFQIFDGIQIVAVGGLRGLGDVNVPMWLTYFIYWCVALPLAALFAFVLHQGAPGVWVGLACGFALAACLLGERLWRKTKNC